MAPAGVLVAVRCARGYARFVVANRAYVAGVGVYCLSGVWLSRGPGAIVFFCLLFAGALALAGFGYRFAYLVARATGTTFPSALGWMSRLVRRDVFRLTRWRPGDWCESTGSDRSA
ncbi:hypothetical protein LX16_0345 [Stackebrandtia albiflava]|uniref:Uncharacterized protein n=1 Tax=Stackebrandtia albiflava TaxID=406432 RepID=A0A562V9Y2_9ACTN|nr:hypothetical protein [Stackebrandtia albiflava]TWJ14658.1 hypothetical protein LX16_0345 [Stackebrandtia albiflava]